MGRRRDFEPLGVVSIALASVAAYLTTRVMVLLLLPMRDELNPIYPKGWSISRALALAGDGAHYLTIARHGYPSPVDSQLRVSCSGLDAVALQVLCPDGAQSRVNDLAFPPLFPAIVRLGTSIGLSDLWALILPAAIGSIVAAALIGIYGTSLMGTRAGVTCAALWGVVPLSVIQMMGRPESLFTAGAAAVLLLLHRGRLHWAATLVALLGTCRVQAAALVIALSWHSLRAMRRGELEVVPAITAVGLSTLGLGLTLANVAVNTGHVDGWVRVQSSWGSSTDGGVAKLVFLRDSLIAWTLPDSAAAASLVVSLVLVMALVKIPDAGPATVYVTALLFMIFVQSDYHYHILRFLIPAFPLLFPVGKLLSRMPLPFPVGFVLASGWLSGYLTHFFFTEWAWSF